MNLMQFVTLLLSACGTGKESIEQVFSLDVPRAEFAREIYTSSDTIVVVVQEDSLMDGAEVHVEWLVNNQPLDVVELHLEPNHFSRGDVVEAQIYQSVGLNRSQDLSLSLVPQNSPPTGALIVVGSELHTDETATVEYTVEDADRDQLGIRIVWYEQSSSLFQVGDQLSADMTVKGQVWLPILTIFDGYTETTLEGDAVTILDSPSEIISVVVNPQNPSVTDTLRAAIETRDLDNDAVPLFYRWSINGLLLEQQTLDGADFAKGDSIVVEASQFSDFSESVYSAPVVIFNTAPEIGSVVLSPEEVYAQDVVDCIPEDTYDIDADPLSILYQWYINGVPQTTDQSLDLALYGAVSRDVATCEIVVSDGDSLSRTVMASVLVSNTAPQIQSASLSHTEIFVTSSVSCIPGPTTDADAQVDFTYQYTWLKNEVDSVSTMPRTNILGLYEVGDEVSCSVLASDGVAVGSSMTSESVVVVNRPPTATQVEIAPSVVYIDAGLMCTLMDYYDEDLNEDQSTVQWLLNGIPVIGATEETWTVYDEVSGESLLNIGDVVTCEIEPSDGIETLPILTVSKTVVNKPPEVLVGYVSPAQPSSSSPVFINAVTRDIDGDVITLQYDWYLNGQLVGNEVSLSAAMLERGDQVQAQITPYSNGVNGVSYLTEIVEIGNGYPYPADPVINPLGPREGIDDLLCSSLTQPSDPDGDPTVHSYSWKVNGNWTMYTVDTIPATELQAGDVWVCLITATDDEGAARSASTYTVVRRPEPLWAELYEFDPVVQLFADTQSDSVAQSYTQRDNRNCWAQQDTWSSLEIEAFRSMTDLEALEVEFTVYSDDTKIDVALWGYDFNQIGISDYLSVWLTEVQSIEGSQVAWGDWYLPFTTSGSEDSLSLGFGYQIAQPHTLRIEVDHLLNQTTVIFDQTIAYQGSDADLIPLQSPKFYLRSVRSNDVADVCWHSIKLFEGNP